MQINIPLIVLLPTNTYIYSKYKYLQREHFLSFFSLQCYSLSGTSCDGPLGESHHHAHHSHHSHHHGGSAVATAQHAHNSHGVASVVSNKNNRRKVSLPYNPCPTSHW